ncbi:MAG TPA: hypothetical protein VF469_38065 [Kofleriaceae bacterium]
MSFKYQSDNNCYAYACCIASNSFAQPGRHSRGSLNLKEPGSFTEANIIKNAMLDGLLHIGGDMPDPGKPPCPGHLVALLFSAAMFQIGGDPLANWYGDFHWVRCDDPDHYAAWSQKDGGDQVTNFDFAGRPIADPRRANWTVNYGPIGLPDSATSTDQNEFKVVYDFVCFMWVPHQGVHII